MGGNIGEQDRLIHLRDVCEGSTSLLKQYYDLSLKLKEILDTVSQENPETVTQITSLLAQREGIIQSYDQLKEEYGHRKKNAPESFLAIFEDQRRQLLYLIKEIEDQNTQNMLVVHKKYKEQVRVIKNGKKLHNAYQGTLPLVDGVFIDKRR